MKTGITILDRQVYNNLQKRTTAFTIEFIVNLPDISQLPDDIYEEVIHVLETHNMAFMTSFTDPERITCMIGKVTGKAKIAESDDIDLDFGRKLADDRAQKKMFHKARVIYRQICEIIDRWYMEEFGDKLSRWYQYSYKVETKLAKDIESKIENKYSGTGF